MQNRVLSGKAKVHTEGVGVHERPSVSTKMGRLPMSSWLGLPSDEEGVGLAVPRWGEGSADGRKIDG